MKEFNIPSLTTAVECLIDLIKSGETANNNQMVMVLMCLIDKANNTPKSWAKEELLSAIRYFLNGMYRACAKSLDRHLLLLEDHRYHHALVNSK